MNIINAAFFMTKLHVSYQVPWTEEESKLDILSYLIKIDKLLERGSYFNSSILSKSQIITEYREFTTGNIFSSLIG